MGSLSLYCCCFSLLLLASPVWAEHAEDRDLLRVPDALVKPGQPALDSEMPEVGELQKLVAAQQWEQAKPLAAQLVAKNPLQPRAHFWLGYVHLRQHDSLAAIRSLRRAQTLGLKDPTLPKTLGLAYYSSHQFILFREQMQKAIGAAPKDPWPLYYLGLYEATILENYEEAWNHFGQALSLQPDDARIRYYRGYCQEVRGDREIARKDYEAAIRLVEGSQAAFSLPYQRMAVLLAEAEPAVALEFAQKAVKKENELASNHLTLAKIYEDQGRLPEAIQALKAAVHVDATLASPHYRLHRLLTKLGEKEAASKALAEFQSLVKLYGS
jgi:tetratricopeptide (TPR) repeat protein